MARKAWLNNPGGPEAIKRGCICPVMDNAHGWGYIVKGDFVVVIGCPLHAPEPGKEAKSGTTNGA